VSVAVWKIRLLQLFSILVISVLMGFTLGVGVVLWDLSEFSNVPTPIVALALALLAGGFVGALAPRFSWALAALLIVFVTGAAVSTLALTYPEVLVDRLGVEIALDLALVRALRQTFLLVPIVVLGILIGRFFARDEY
jgi:hypothetical protein